MGMTLPTIRLSDPRLQQPESADRRRKVTRVGIHLSDGSSPVLAADQVSPANDNVTHSIEYKGGALASGVPIQLIFWGTFWWSFALLGP